MEIARAIQVAVGRSIELGGVALERMRAELLDVDLGRRREALRPERVEADRLAAFVAHQRQAMLGARLVAGDERRPVGDGGVGTRDVGGGRLLFPRVRAECALCGPLYFTCTRFRSPPARGGF